MFNYATSRIARKSNPQTSSPFRVDGIHRAYRNLVGSKQTFPGRSGSPQIKAPSSADRRIKHRCHGRADRGRNGGPRSSTDGRLNRTIPEASVAIASRACARLGERLGPNTQHMPAMPSGKRIDNFRHRSGVGALGACISSGSRRSLLSSHSLRRATGVSAPSLVKISHPSGSLNFDNAASRPASHDPARPEPLPAEPTRPLPRSPERPLRLPA